MGLLNNNEFLLPGMEKILTVEEGRVIIGDYCEKVIQSIFGNGERGFPFGDRVLDLVYWHERTIIIEVKGFSVRYGCQVNQEQLSGLLRLQKNNFPFTDPRIFYALVPHLVTGIERNQYNIDQLKKTLSINTVGVWIIPIEILYFMPRYIRLNQLKSYQRKKSVAKHDGVKVTFFLSEKS